MCKTIRKISCPKQREEEKEEEGEGEGGIGVGAGGEGEVGREREAWGDEWRGARHRWKNMFPVFVKNRRAIFLCL